jgi:hypothetical protein
MGSPEVARRQRFLYRRGKMERCECPFCKAQAECKEPNNLVVFCPACGTFEVTSDSMRYYFRQGRLDETALKKIQEYVQQHQSPIPVLSKKKIAELTGVGTGPDNKI